VVLVVVAAVCVTVGLVAVTTAGRSRPHPATGLLAAIRSYALVYTGPRGTRLVPLDGRRPIQLSTTESGSPLEAAGSVALVESHTVLLVAGPAVVNVRSLGAGESLFPMLWPDTIGVAALERSGQTSASFVDLSGNGMAGATWVLPPGYRPAAQFLAIGPDGMLTEWSPGTGRTARLGVTIGRAVSLIGQSPDAVAWSGRGCDGSGECPLRLSPSNAASLDGPDTSTLVPPLPGHSGYLPTGAMSPDGQYIATFIAAGGGAASLVIVDLADRRTQAVAHSRVSAHGSLPVAEWGTAGTFLFFSGSSGSMHAWAVGDTAATTLKFPASTSFAVTIDNLSAAGQRGDRRERHIYRDGLSHPGSPATS
jgi:hypothetical protein